MAPTSLADEFRRAVCSYGASTIVEDCSGSWKLSGDQLLQLMSALHTSLAQYSRRTLVVYLEKSPLYYAFLAFAFANRINFCPVDKNNPIGRLVQIAKQLPAALILVDSSKCLEQVTSLQQDIETLLFACEANEEDRPFQFLESDRPVYFIATSGSTGQPKLVRVPHDNTVPFIQWAKKFYEIDASCRWAQFSSIGFDLSLVDFLSVICGNGTLVALTSKFDRLRPALAIQRGRITHWHSVPSMIPYFLHESMADPIESSCRLFTFCGEPLMQEDARRLSSRYSNARIVNTYGPTETTLFCSYFDYDRNDSSLSGYSLPIGCAIPSWNFLLLPADEYFRLIILSDNVADGYEGVSSDKFATVQLFGSCIRAFDTGDYFRRSGDHLYFSHRADGMVKISGNRVDLGEIEAVAKLAGLLNPIALLTNNAITLCIEGSEYDEEKLAEVLAAHLPTYSIPSAVKCLDTMPRTVNGKIDRYALNSYVGGMSERSRV